MPREGIAVAGNLNRKYHKALLYLIKVIPIIIAFSYMFDVILSYFNMDVPALSYLTGTSFITLALLYMASFVFKFCPYHRMFIHYVALYNIITAYDYHFGIPLANKALYNTMFFISIVVMFTILYHHVKGDKKIAVQGVGRY